MLLNSFFPSYSFYFLLISFDFRIVCNQICNQSRVTRLFQGMGIMAFLVKRNETYYIRYNKNGRMAWRSCRTNKKAIAKEILRKFTDESARVEWNLSKGRKISFQDLCAKYIDSAYGIKSEDWIKIESIYIHTHYLPFFGANELAKNITKERIEEYRIHRLKKVSKGTVNKETTVLVSILRKERNGDCILPIWFPKSVKSPSKKDPPGFCLKTKWNV